MTTENDGLEVTRCAHTLWDYIETAIGLFPKLSSDALALWLLELSSPEMSHYYAHSALSVCVSDFRNVVGLDGPDEEADDERSSGAPDEAGLSLAF